MKNFLKRHFASSMAGAFLVSSLLGGSGCASSPSIARRSSDYPRRDESFVGQQRTTVTTGSNLVQNANVSGNNADTRSRTSVYGQADLQRTGTNDVGGSLKRLDPSIH